jgi:LysR family transcriptional regulator, cys regulon transcriptional activator
MRIIREAARRNFNLTEVGNALATSQSGVSKHIRELEDELGVALFIRRGKRLLDFTDPGRRILPFVERILSDLANIRRAAEDLAKADHGELIIATTHTQARYTLPGVIAGFRKAFPNVHLTIHQSSPTEIARMLLEDRADIGVATEALAHEDDLVVFPYQRWRHTIIVPPDHPLNRSSPVRLQDIAEFPVITYQKGFTGRPMIDRAFKQIGVTPDIVLEAIDSDVIKAYVALGMGVGIISELAVDSTEDTRLTRLSAEHLFDESISYIALRRHRFLRGYSYRFLLDCLPGTSETELRGAVESPSD